MKLLVGGLAAAAAAVAVWAMAQSGLDSHRLPNIAESVLPPHHRSTCERPTCADSWLSAATADM